MIKKIRFSSPELLTNYAPYFHRIDLKVEEKIAHARARHTRFYSDYLTTLRSNRRDLCSLNRVKLGAFDHSNRAQMAPILGPNSREILTKMKHFLNITQIRLIDFLRHLRVSTTQSYSAIEDNWDQKTVGGQSIRSGNILRKLAKMIKIGARGGSVWRPRMN